MRLPTCTAIAAALVLSTAACQQQESPTANEPAATEAAAGDIGALGFRKMHQFAGPVECQRAIEPVR